MSHSYKRTPRAGDTKDKFYKRYANRRLRRLPIEEPTLNNCSYKKYNCSWLICDYDTVGISFEEYWLGLLKSWHNWEWRYGRPFPDRDKAYQDYCRWFVRK